MFIRAMILWIKKHLNNKQFIYFSCVLVGFSSGTAAIFLKYFAHLIYSIATYNNKAIDNKYFLSILPVIGIFLTILFVKKFLNGKIEKGLSQIHLAIAKKSSNVPSEQIYTQIATSSLTVGLGGSAGLEAPIVITGAAVGATYSKRYHLSQKEKTLLLACGISAGISAAFNAPVAGVLFALEVLLLNVSISAFIPLIIASASGALISKIILQDDVLLGFESMQPFNYRNTPFYILLGISAGLLSVYYSRIYTGIESRLNNSRFNVYFKAVTGSLVLVLLILIFPSLFGEGYKSIKVLSQQHPENLLRDSFFCFFQNNEWFVLFFTGIIMFIKPIATALTIGSGGNGGNFAPSLFTGAYLGFFFSRLFNFLHLTKLPESNFTVVGMAGILSGLYHAPLTAIFLIAEITGGYSLMLPLMIVTSVSFAVSKYFEHYSLDTKVLAEKDRIFTSDKDKNILSAINSSSLIETNFHKVQGTDTLGQLVNIISSSKRNIFPVTNKNDELIGIVLLDDIRDIIFKTELYDKIYISEIMKEPPEFVLFNETMESIVSKFDRTGTWNLPVVDNKKYIGFISKSAVFSNYRQKLLASTIE